MDNGAGTRRSATDLVTTATRASLPMKWLAAGIPLTLLIDLAEPGHSAEIALHEGVNEALHIRLCKDAGRRRHSAATTTSDTIVV